MILIADSGSTKTDWRLLDAKKNISDIETIGLSPYFLTAQQIIDTLRKDLLPSFPADNISNVYFYGTGLANENNKKIIEDSFRILFPSASIYAHHDLLGAARAVCGKEEGIAAILGTGSNSCVYDGEKIIENTPSLGFILGDEGSGAYLGKKLIQGFLNKEIPTSLFKKFEYEYALSKNDILEKVYKKQFPNKYLASFTRFISSNITEDYMENIVISSFEDFFDKHILKYSRYQKIPMSCVGSIAFYFQTILKSVAVRKGVHVKKIMDKPIEGLVHYHSF